MIIDWHAHIYTPEEAADDKGAWDGKEGPRWGERGWSDYLRLAGPSGTGPWTLAGRRRLI